MICLVQGTQDKYVDGIAAALTHVHANSMEEMNAQWAKESGYYHFTQPD